MLNEGLYEQVISKALSSELENPEQIVDKIGRASCRERV